MPVLSPAPGHIEIEQKDVGLLPLKDVQDLQAVFGFSDDAEILFNGEKPAERIPKDRVVVGDGDADFVRRASTFLLSSNQLLRTKWTQLKYQQYV
jgi:hypothetical protein